MNTNQWISYVNPYTKQQFLFNLSLYYKIEKCLEVKDKIKLYLRYDDEPCQADELIYSSNDNRDHAYTWMAHLVVKANGG
jgi:hypothetical protein